MTADDASEPRNLALAVHRGAEGALEELIATFERPLQRYAVGLLLNSADAQDVVQDAIVRAHRALTRRYDESRCAALALRPWLFRTVRNLCLNRRRSKMRASEEPLTAMTEQGLEPFVREQSDAAERAQELAAVAAALETLPSSSRELIILRFIQEMSYAEIAGTLGGSEAAWRGRVFRALRQLRAALEQKGTSDAL